MIEKNNFPNILQAHFLKYFNMLRYGLISILIMDFFYAVYGCHPVLLDFTKLGVDVAKPNLEKEGKYQACNLSYRSYGI